MSKQGKRTTFTLNAEMSEEVRKATVEAVEKSKMVIKQADLINFLVKHHLNDAVEGVVREKTKP